MAAADRVRLLRIALDRLEEAPMLDDSAGRELYSQLRRDVITAGAEEQDVDWLTTHVVRWIVESSGLFTEEMKHRQIDLVTELFSQKGVSVNVVNGKAHVRVGNESLED